MKIRTNHIASVMEYAQKVLDKKFQGNITIKAEPEKVQRDGRPVVHVRLGVKSSNGPGGRRSREGRKIAAACWHAYGEFFDALAAADPECEIQVAGLNDRKWLLAEDHGWQDSNIGSMYYPLYHSEACEC